MSGSALPIRATGFGFRYVGEPRAAIHGLDLGLEPGQVLLVVGPSGSGKSTLARAIAGLLPGELPGEWTGSLTVGDVSVHAASRATVAAAVGIVFQDPGSQLVMERAEDDVAFGLENRGWALQAMHERVPAALTELGLGGFEERRPNRLSGGEQQRLAIAGVLAAEPRVLVLDEPTANLDPAGTAAVYERLAPLAAARSTTIVLVEHRVERAWGLADQVLALGADGGPIDAGTPAAVLKRSRSRLEREGVWLPDGPTPRAASRRAAIRQAAPGHDATGHGAPGLVAAGRASAADTGEARLSLREAWFGYEPGSAVLHGVSLEVHAGEQVALVGANGSGKSTLLRLALGLLRPTAGVVRLGGADPARLNSRQLAARAGYVVQDPELGFVGDTVRQEVAAGLAPEELERAEAVAARLALPLGTFGDRSPYQLSGGEQRRLSLVTALAHRPPLLVLDEPTYGQDRHGHDELVEILAELAADGTAVLAATHDDRFVGAFADRTLELGEGWLL